MKQTIWKYIKADALFRDYLPHVKNYKHKIRGESGNKKPIAFTDKEAKEIKSAIKKMMQNTLINKKDEKL